MTKYPMDTKGFMALQEEKRDPQSSITICEPPPSSSTGLNPLLYRLQSWYSALPGTRWYYPGQVLQDDRFYFRLTPKVRKSLKCTEKVVQLYHMFFQAFYQTDAEPFTLAASRGVAFYNFLVCLGIELKLTGVESYGLITSVRVLPGKSRRSYLSLQMALDIEAAMQQLTPDATERVLQAAKNRYLLRITSRSNGN